jgi:hypothetical protein
MPRAEDHRFRAVSAAVAQGRLNGMKDTQRDARVSDDSTEVQAEVSSAPEATAVTVARMLANPRRIRRD